MFVGGFLGGLSVTFSCKASCGSDEELLKAVEEIELVSTKGKNQMNKLGDEEYSAIRIWFSCERT